MLADVFHQRQCVRPERQSVRPEEGSVCPERLSVRPEVQSAPPERQVIKALLVITFNYLKPRPLPDRLSETKMNKLTEI